MDLVPPGMMRWLPTMRTTESCNKEKTVKISRDRHIVLVTFRIVVCGPTNIFILLCQIVNGKDKETMQQFEGDLTSLFIYI